MELGEGGGEGRVLTLSFDIYQILGTLRVFFVTFTTTLWMKYTHFHVSDEEKENFVLSLHPPLNIYPEQIVDLVH